MYIRTSRYPAVSPNLTSSVISEHEKEYFQAVVSLVHLRSQSQHSQAHRIIQAHLSDDELAGFSADDFDLVRVGASAYGMHIFGRVKIPALPADGPCYVFFRLCDKGKDEEATFHSFHTEQSPDEANGGFKYRAIFTKDDPIEWFDE